MKAILRSGIIFICLCASLVSGQTTSAPASTTTATATAAKAEKIVVVKLEGEVTEAPPGIDIGLPDLKMNLFWDQLRLVRMVKNDSSVQALVLLVDQPSLSLAQSQQLALELARLRKSGKRVYVHADGLTTGLYMLALPADEIGMSPGGTLQFNGLAAQVIYYKGLMAKLGIEAEVEHFGDFKLAAEPFTATQPSKFMDEQMNDLVDSLYSQIVTTTARFRGLREPHVKAIIDRGPFLSEQAKKEGLIDRVVHRGEMLNQIEKELSGKLVFDYARTPAPEIKSGFGGLMQIFGMIGSKGRDGAANRIAIVYVTGAVVEGESEEFFSSAQTAGSKTMRKAFAKIRKDDRIKAVVLRIDSPGGSSSASEVIWELAAETAKTKPVIVSMGSVAGSGGYYIAAAGSYIYASPATLTGSIGVVAGKPVLKGLMDKIDLNAYTYARGKNAGLFDPFSKLTASQRENLQGQMEIIFNQFKDRVMLGRKDKIKDIVALATGRVFTGEQAIKLGLVDRIGTLADAVDRAAADAKITSYDVVHLPEPKTLPEILLEGLGYKMDPEEVMMSRGNLPMLKILGVDASLIRETLTVAEMLKRGNVLMLAPYHIELR
jgi:protease-4